MTKRTTKPVPRPCACTTVRKTSRTLARIYDAALRQTDLNVTQLAVLRAIQRNPQLPLSRVAEELLLDRTSFYRAIGTMERSGWLRVTAGADARSRTAHVTADGQAVLDQANPSWERVQGELVRQFGVGRWNRLVGELDALRDIAQRLGEATE